MAMNREDMRELLVKALAHDEQPKRWMYDEAEEALAIALGLLRRRLDNLFAQAVANPCSGSTRYLDALLEVAEEIMGQAFDEMKKDLGLIHREPKAVADLRAAAEDNARKERLEAPHAA